MGTGRYRWSLSNRSMNRTRRNRASFSTNQQPQTADCRLPPKKTLGIARERGIDTVKREP